jgi:hypothetical protein
MTIAGFTPTERAITLATLKERYGFPVDIACGTAQIALGEESGALTECPVCTWNVADINFVVFKLGASRFRAQFYTADNEQYGVGRSEFDNLGDCVITLLQVQTTHEEERRRLKRSINAAVLPDPESYDGPLMI